MATAVAALAEGCSREMRYAVAKEVEQLVSDLDDSVQKWYFGLKPHVQKAYCAKDRACSVQVPVIRHLASIFGWGDMDIFDELTEGFPLLGSCGQVWGGAFVMTPVIASRFPSPSFGRRTSK